MIVWRVNKLRSEISHSASTLKLIRWMRGTDNEYRLRYAMRRSTPLKLSSLLGSRGFCVRHCFTCGGGISFAPVGQRNKIRALQSTRLRRHENSLMQGASALIHFRNTGHFAAFPLFRTRSSVRRTYENPYTLIRAGGDDRICIRRERLEQRFEQR